MKSFLEQIKSPQDIKQYSIDELKSLASEIREFLISSVSKTGGHIGANLGVIELTIAIHYTFNLPEDKVVFDTGHQGYTHKLLTGRKALFETLNQLDGMSRFLCREESIYDIIDASHAGTAISIATGIATQCKADQINDLAIAFIGDGCLVEGMSSEGLNFGASTNLPLIIIINDNGMSIPKNVGGIYNLFSGPDWSNKSRFYFEGMGYGYIPIADGHDLDLIISKFKEAKTEVKDKSMVIHAKTEKGRGLPIAKDHPYKMHFSMPFNPQTGEGSSPTPAGKTYSVVAGEKLYELLKCGTDITILTPSTPYASGLDNCLIEFPDKTIDVGMAEQHALGMASGLALGKKNCFVYYQSTFMQRAMDQILHDVCFMDLPVTILAVRSGFAGFDSPTHHGIYDISYLRGIPNLQIFYAGTSNDLVSIIDMRANNPVHPMVILHPYESIRQDENDYINSKCKITEMETIFNGKDGYILSVGNTLGESIKLRNELYLNNVEFGLINIRWIKPLQYSQLVNILKNNKRIITTEENIKEAGFGSSIAEIITDEGLECQLLRNAICQGFVKPGNKDDLVKIAKIDYTSMLRKVKEKWGDLF